MSLTATKDFGSLPFDLRGISFCVATASATKKGGLEQIKVEESIGSYRNEYFETSDYYGRLRNNELWEDVRGFPRESLSTFYSLEKNMRLLQGFYLLREPDILVNFLREHSYLVEILLEGFFKIGDVFGPTPSLELELHIDPEENYEEVFALIRTYQAPEEALRLLNKLDEEWFLNVIGRTKGKLNFALR